MKLRKILALSLVILSLAAMFALPISANSGSSTSAPRIYFVKYYEGNDTAVLQEVVYFLTLNYDYQLQVTGDDLYFGNVTFNFDVPDESQSYTFLSVVNMIGFSMVGYRSDLHTEPTYMIDYAPGLLWNGTFDLENSGTPYWICQLFVDDYYTGSDGLTGSNIWNDIIEVTPPDDDGSEPWVYFFKYYEGNDLFEYYDLLRFDTVNYDYLLSVAGGTPSAGDVTFSFDHPDNSESIYIPSLSNMFGFSFLSYYSTPHTEPTYIAEYDEDVIFSGSVNLSNPGSQRIWICQIFVDGNYSGNNGITDPWAYLFDNPSNPDYRPPYDWDEIESKYQDIEDKINSYNSSISIESSAPGDVGDLVLHFGGGNADPMRFFQPTVLAPISYVLNSPYVLLFLVIAFTFALVAYILFGKRG